MCTFMLLDPATLNLHFYSSALSHKRDSQYAGEQHSSGPAGLYVDLKNQQKRVIALAEEGLLQPAQLAATICHELAHVHLLGNGRLKQDEEDGEPLTDLLTVYFGAGIFTANSVFQFTQWQSGTRIGWHASTRGSLSEQVYSYALASFAWFRGDTKAPWQRHLRQNIEYYFSDALHFLVTTSDTTIPYNGA
jgi:hypothetical protein